MAWCAMSTRSCVAPLFTAAVVLLLWCGTTAVAQTCLSGCMPWSSNDRACKRGSLMKLLFELDLAPEFVYDAVANYTNATYAFCPTVDQLQNFNLQLAPYFSTAYNTTVSGSSVHTYAFSPNLQPKYLSLYGFGNTVDRLSPMRDLSSGSVLIAINGSTMCGNPDSVAVVNALVLNVGLHNGLFNYIASSPTGNFTIPGYALSSLARLTANTTAVHELKAQYLRSLNVYLPNGTKQAAMTGFVPTCSSNDVCLFDSSLKCLGYKSGQKNCAQCYTNAGDLLLSSINVWVSYYGTDSSHETLLSGSNNPLNFLTFAAQDILQRFITMLGSLL